jgi:hypothetical protein
VSALTLTLPSAPTTRLFRHCLVRWPGLPHVRQPPRWAWTWEAGAGAVGPRAAGAGAPIPARAARSSHLHAQKRHARLVRHARERKRAAALGAGPRV